VKRLPVLVFCLLAGPTLAQSEDVTPSQRACMTTLSLASRFATTEGQRTTFDQQYLRLNRLISAGTDVVAEAASDESPVTNKAYDDWVMTYDLADDATRSNMVNDIVAEALACADIIPDETPAAQ